MIHFKRIGNRLLIAVGSVVVIGVIALALINASRQERALTHEIEISLARVADSVAEGLKALMLGGHAQAITDKGFLDLFDEPEWMVAQLERAREDNTPALCDWNDKILSVQASTLCDQEASPIGSAALIRDVTEEKRLECQLKEQSITDALTVLNNRRYFDEALQTEFMRWRRYAQPVSVMMLDVDHFKKFNDTNGHECGDRVLEAIGGTLKSIVRPSVIPCRYGGEEMVIIMPGQAQEQALTLAETIRREIADLVIEGLKVTVSIGVAGCPGHEVADAEALYVAKESGRNQVRAAASAAVGDACGRRSFRPA